MDKLNENMLFMLIFESWATIENPFNSTEDILEWIEQENSKRDVSVNKLNYAYDGFWHYDKNYNGIINDASSFFKICGLRYKDEEKIIEQPIIIQNEIGYLGIIGKVFDGVLYFLMQAKIEPGNINKIQISPTIQATKSNFMRAHGGKEPAYLSYFSHKNNYEIIADQIQSEQSSRFLGKRNRNIIIIVDDDIEVLESHKWMTLGQIKQLMHYDNLVNMDTRTVLSNIPFSLQEYSYKEITHIRTLFQREAFFNSLFFGNAFKKTNKIFQYINDVKMLRNFERHVVNLTSLENWRFSESGEFESNCGNFKVVYCDIKIKGREVQNWQQPLLESVGKSIFGLIYHIDRDNRMQFLVQTKLEVGCFDQIEIAPSIQKEPMDDKVINIVDAIFFKKFETGAGVEFRGLFSEEGGRFYHEENENVIMQVSLEEIPELPDGYFWADFQTLNLLIQFNNCLNIQLRNLMSILEL